MIRDEYHERRLKAMLTPDSIRNICVIAHVDHGKTTLTDCLLSSNKIISKSLAGKLRFLDSREDEQEREITMKSSSISLVFENEKTGADCLINLIDSPGHVDFAFEVSSGLKVCDNAVLVVDVIEGVCSQTYKVLNAAVKEGLRIVLLINKIDKLFTDMKTDLNYTYFMISRILSQANAALSLAFSKLIFSGDLTEGQAEKLEKEASFDPLKSNVIFASSHSNWAFTLDHFSGVFAQALGGANPEKAKQFLWGDFYLNPKDKKILKKPINEGQHNTFTQFILKNIGNIYTSILEEKDKAKLEKITKVLKIELPASVSSRLESEPGLVALNVMSSWLPLSPCFYKIALEYFYAPAQSQAYRLYSICKLYRTLRGNKEKFAKVLPFKEAIEKADRDGKLIAYISKMIFVPNKNINDKNNTGSQFLTGKSLAAKYDTTISNGNFFAFTRVFSGKLRVGDTIYLITSVFDKEDNEEKVKAFEFKVSRLYIWMGYHLDQVEEVGAGCICALPDLGEYNVKFATIADNPECPPLNKIKFENNLIKVAIKTKDLSEMGKLSEGLKILKKVDPAIETFYDEKGDIILETSGEVHLDRCLKDLQDEFARVEIEVSEPIVTFKETITATKFRSYTNKKKEEIKKIRAENQQAFKEDNKKVNRDKEDDEDKAKDEEEVEPEMVQESSERLISDTKDSVSGKAPSKSGALAAPGVLKTDSEGRQEQQPGHVSVEKAENLQNKNTSDDNQLNLTESLTNEDATISNGDGHNAAPTQDKDSCSLHEPKPQSVSGTFQKTPSEKSHADKNLTPKKAKASESTKDIDENLSGQKRSKQTLDKDPDQKAKKGTKAGKDLGANTKNNSQKESHKGETKEKTDKKKQNEPKEASRKEGTTKKMLTDAKAGTKDPPEEENDLENKEKLYRWNTESSSFFDTTSEEEPIDPSKAVEEWLYDDDRGTEKKDEEDTRFIYKESNFVYQKKRVEEVKVNRKGVNLKVGNQGFLGLQRKKNHCEVLTQNKKFKVAVRAVGLGPKAAEFIDTHRNKVRKLFGNGPNMKRQADCVKFLKSLFKILEEDKTDPALLKMIIRHLVNFGPHKIGPNLLLCKFAENSETLTGPLLKDIDEFKDIFVRSKRTESYIKDRPDYEQYYAGVSYEELIKSIQVGFELTLEKGPLCNEEVYGCVFIVEDFINCDEENIRQKNLHEKLKKNEEREKREKHVTELEKQIKDKEDQSSSNQMNTTELTSKEASVHKDDVQTLQVPPLQVHEVDHDHHSTDQKDSNMLEMIKNEGISCNKSKNSKSVMTDENISADPYGPISTQMVSAVKKGCTDSFLGAGPRLVHGLILCTVFVDQETLSSVLDSLYMRRAEIIENEFEHLTNMFIVKAHMPIQESFGFFEKIMKLTSGKVSPQLEFYGWQIIDIDPFYQPTTVDEREEHGDKMFVKNYPRQQIEKMREKKGMMTDKKTIAEGDKQVTLSRTR